MNRRSLVDGCGRRSNASPLLRMRGLRFAVAYRLYPACSASQKCLHGSGTVLFLHKKTRVKAIMTLCRKNSTKVILAQNVMEKDMSKK